jgi:hypothetical protein
MRSEDFVSEAEMAELRAIRDELTSVKEVAPVKTEKQAKHERAEAILAKATVQMRLKAFNDQVGPMIRGFVTKVKNCAHDRGQCENMKIDSFVDGILAKVKLALMTD